MTGINGDDGVPASGDRSVEIRVAARLENLAVLRTLVAAAATFEDLDIMQYVLRSLVSDVRTFGDGQHAGAGRLVGISLTAKRVGLLQ